MAILSPKSIKKTRRVARKAMDRAVLSFVNGLVYVVDGSASPPIGNVAPDRGMERGAPGPRPGYSATGAMSSALP